MITNISFTDMLALFTDTDQRNCYCYISKRYDVTAMKAGVVAGVDGRHIGTIIFCWIKL